MRIYEDVENVVTTLFPGSGYWNDPKVLALKGKEKRKLLRAVHNANA